MIIRRRQIPIDFDDAVSEAKLRSVLGILIIILLASCSPNPVERTSEEVYAGAMEPILEEIRGFYSEDIGTLSELFAFTFLDEEGNIVDADEADMTTPPIGMWLYIMGSPDCQNPIEPEQFPPRCEGPKDKIVELLESPLDSAIFNGMSIMSKIVIIFPPQEIRTAHEEVLLCLQRETQYFSMVDVAIHSNFEWVDMPTIYACDNIEKTIDEIDLYIQQNK